MARALQYTVHGKCHVKISATFSLAGAVESPTLLLRFLHAVHADEIFLVPLAADPWAIEWLPPAVCEAMVPSGNDS